MKEKDMKAFFVRYKKTLLSLLRIVLAIAALSLLALGALLLCGIVYIDGGIQINLALFEKWRSSPLGALIIVGVQVLVTTFLCFLPGTTMTFLVLLPLLYEKLWQAFLVALAGTFLSSMAMFAVGRFGGRTLCEKFLGKEDTEKAAMLLRSKGTVYFPLMMLFPVFPDDALVMIAGTLGMKLSWFIPSVVIGRGIGVVSMIFGFGSIPYERFTTPLHWILFLLITGVLVLALFLAAHLLNRYLNRKK